MTNTIFNDIGYLGSLRAEAASAPNKAINEVASQFEALFIQQMMKSMRDAVPKSDLMSSDHLDTYQAMADQQMAVNLSQQGGYLPVQGFFDQEHQGGTDGRREHGGKDCQEVHVGETSSSC